MTSLKKIVKKSYLLTVTLIIFLILSHSSLGIVQNFEDNSRPFISQSSTNQKSTIFYGVLPDAAPISNLDGTRGWLGYCEDLRSYLEKDIYKNYTIEIAEVDYQNRFKGIGKFNNEQVYLDVECGSNTITPKRKETLRNSDYPGKFSDPFFRTGGKILLKKGNKSENLKKYYEDELFKNEKEIIAVIGNKKESELQKNPDTTTNTLVQGIYPNAQIEVFPNRNIALDEFEKQTDIIAYISDEIILKALIRNSEEFAKKKYALIPKNGLLSHEDYGVVIYENGKINDLYTVINNWINSKEQGVKSKNKLEKYNQENFWGNFWNQQISNWYKGDLKFLWLILFLAMILPLIFFNIIWPFLISNFVKSIPEKFALWLYKVSKGRIIVILVDFENKAIIEDKILKATIAELPSYSPEQINFKESLIQLNKEIVENSELDSKRKQEALDGLREIAYKCKKQNIQGDGLKNLLNGLHKVFQTLNTGISGMNTFSSGLNELKTNINNLLN